MTIHERKTKRIIEDCTNKLIDYSVLMGMTNIFNINQLIELNKKCEYYSEIIVRLSSEQVCDSLNRIANKIEELK